jgi:hypothetical protein
LNKFLLLPPVLLIIGVIISLIISGTGTPVSDNGKIAAGDSHRTIRYGYTIQNKSDQLVENADFWTFAPVKQAAGQRCINVASSYPCKIIRDRLGNQVLWFRLEKIPPYACRVITITADILFAEGAVDKVSNPASKLFLNPGPGIESNHPAIVDQSCKLIEATQEETTARIYHWVSKHIRYSCYSDGTMGALYALRHRKGDCTEYASLFVAMCRAADIPARVIGGYVCTENGVLKPSDYHDWAEFRIREYWRIADPQKRKLPAQNNAYIAMCIQGESSDKKVPSFRRFRVSSEALRVKMNS